MSGDDAALLSDLATLRLNQGDAEGAQELFRKALAAQQEQQVQGDDGAAAAAPAEEAGEEQDSWEAWDEATVPPPQPPQPPARDESSWEAAAPPRAAARGSPAAGPASSGNGAAAAEELPFGGGHVLEFFELSSAVRTTHLEAFLQRLGGGAPGVPPNIRWVDECHAAVVCPDPPTARRLLAAAAAPPAPDFRLRGYADASSGTRALQPSDLRPPVPRPATSAAVARRLIGGALNMRLRDKDGEQALAAARRQQRQEREERQQALDSTWGD